MANEQVYKIRFRQGQTKEWVVRTRLRGQAREKIRAQLKADPLTGVEVWADGRKLTRSEQDRLIGDVPI
ncbi:MAG TPA: hypothetical protein VLV76_22635 [Candidatus Acidoferrum sp.]|nr:hypothetical protein [Candidatus Acidoferrum sp.]